MISRWRWLLVCWSGVVALAAMEPLDPLPPQYQPQPRLPQPAASTEVHPVQASIDARLQAIDEQLAELARNHGGVEPRVPIERLDPGPTTERERRDASWVALQDALRQAARDRPAPFIDVIAQPPSPAEDRLVRELQHRNRLGLAIAWQGVVRDQTEAVELAEQALTVLGSIPAEEVPADEQLRWRYLTAWFHRVLQRHGAGTAAAEEHAAQIRILAAAMANRAPQDPLTLAVQAMVTGDD